MRYYRGYGTGKCRTNDRRNSKTVFSKKDGDTTS